MGFDPEFDRDGFAKGGRAHARAGALMILAVLAALALPLGVLLVRSESTAVEPATPTIAPPDDPAPDRLIVNRATGYCLDIPYGGEEPKTPVEQFPVNGGANQLWRLEPAPDGAVRIVNRQTGQCLDVPNGTTEPGVAVEQYTRHDGPNQRWRLEEAGGGWCRIVNQLTGLCLQVAGESPDRRARIEQMPVGDSPYQQWRALAVR